MRYSPLLFLAVILLALPILARPTAEKADTTPPVKARAIEAPSKLQPRAPQASKRMGQRRRQQKKDVLKKKDYSSFLCPGGAVACPVSVDEITEESTLVLQSGLNSLADWFRVGFECIELDTELNQCGGCLALGTG